MKLEISKLKNLTSKLSLAVEKSKLNPKSGWVELIKSGSEIVFKVSNYDYYLNVSIPIFDNDTEDLHVTILAETFIPLISKIDDEVIDIYEKLNSLIIDTANGSYTIPLIKEMGKTKSIDIIEFNCNSDIVEGVYGDDLALVADVNTKGLVDTLFSKDIQQYIYIDNIGALTFTENIYAVSFPKQYDVDFKMLLTYSQARLLSIFKDLTDLNIEFERKPTFNTEASTTNKVKISGSGVSLILNTQDMNIVDKFPSIKLRYLCENPGDTYIIVDKKQLDKALARLMIFDKKFDITVMDYSKLVFKENELELVSIRNKNIERIPYINSNNVIEHESIIRFADLVKQLKSINDRTINIGYGSRPAIVLNNEHNIYQIVPEIKIKETRV